LSSGGSADGVDFLLRLRIDGSLVRRHELSLEGFLAG
jgi:hypothetical protein